MSFLAEIVARKSVEVAQRRSRVPDEALEARLGERSRSGAALSERLSSQGGPVAVIAEVKRGSPSLGAIRPALDVRDQVTRYAGAGAAAISVLTDGPGFGGSLEDLRAAREVTSLPLLRKDFVVDRYQLLEAADAGASAALLIVAAVSRPALRGLLRDAMALQLEILVEVHDESELDVALSEGAALVGINNRNLRTFDVDLAVSERLARALPRSVKAVSESGVRTAEDVARLRGAGLSNFLVGEALVRAEDPAALLRTFLEGSAR